MAKVIRKEDESLDAMLKRFKKKVQNEGILQELNKRSYYVSKGEKDRLKHQKALRAIRKKQKKQKMMDR